MKRMILTLAFASAASIALAEEAVLPDAPATTEVAAEQPAAPQHNPFAIRAPVVDPGEHIDLGDILTINRGFETWNLGCSVRISSGRRSCSIEQVVVDAAASAGVRSSVKWGIGSSAAKKSLLFVHVTSNFASENGMRLSFAGVEKTIPQQEWFCSNEGCITAFPFEGIVQSAIQSSQEIGFTYKVKAPTGEISEVDLRGNMGGFDKALQVAATNPFASVASPPKPAELKKEEPTAKAAPKAAASAPKKPAKPVRQEARNNAPKQKASELY
ncbi:invasion associated locus B family protein [Agrobacterium genomosp. 3]|uniref:invasion associated locus B family protein n=1 Tax=Agrobacterium tomkonis TaxID=1183410 RepID=UPI001CD8C4F7|nr:invasion associated locus B family protein [Agrobacterium tomkonis]MCA1878889.1 invasion associated locus B family protein [Agrobacterium tumefaciens]MCA1894118.1 invasion associated locus B family protein [Agrobacterium tomkonis]